MKSTSQPPGAPIAPFPVKSSYDAAAPKRKGKRNAAAALSSDEDDDDDAGAVG